MDKIILGSFWLSFGSIFRGFGGCLPDSLVSNDRLPQHQTVAQALFNTAYTPYALLH